MRESRSRRVAVCRLCVDAGMFCVQLKSARISVVRHPRKGRHRMAQKVHITLEDDLAGGDAAETVSFGLDGRSYEIDLNAKTAQALREALSKYVAAARRAGGRSGAAKRRTQVGTSAREIRDWARSNGRKVPDRGRIPSEVREAFEAA